MKWKLKIDEENGNLGDTTLENIDGFIVEDGLVVLVSTEAVFCFEKGKLRRIGENPMLKTASIDELQDEIFGDVVKVTRILRNVTIIVKEESKYV